MRNFMYVCKFCRQNHSKKLMFTTHDIVRSIHVSASNYHLANNDIDSRTLKLSIHQQMSDDFLLRVKKNASRGLPIVHHHDYVSEIPPQHRFAMKKFHGVMKFLRKDNIISMKQVVQPREISIETTELAHSANYVDKFFHGKTTKEEQRKTGFQWNKGLVRRCRLETGGTVLGCQLAKERGLSCSTGGGTHHAFPDYGSGFCLINDLAVAAKYARKSGLADKVLIVDLDVHQGDGTALIFRDDDNVFTFSIHCGSNFPLEKQQSDVDVSLPDHIGDRDYMKTLSEYLPAILDSFRPDLVLYDAGVDPHIKDELGKLDLTDQGVFTRDHYVLEQVLSRGIPCTTVIGGGYCKDIQELSLRHTIIHRAATKIWWKKGF